MPRKISLIAVLLATTPVLLPDPIFACAVCITGAAGERLTDAFNWSVLFLMAMPYAILASVGGYLFYSYRRASKRSGDAGEKPRFFRLAWVHKERGR